MSETTTENLEAVAFSLAVGSVAIPTLMNGDATHDAILAVMTILAFFGAVAIGLGVYAYRKIGGSR